MNLSAPMNQSVSVIIPVNDFSHPIPALERLREIAPPELLEILLVEGNAPGKQRNIAVEQSLGEFLYFLDDDSEVNCSTLAIAVSTLSASDAVAIGGPAITRKTAKFRERVFGELLGSWIVAGPTYPRNTAVGRLPRASLGTELQLCNLLIKRSAFINSNGLRGDIYPGEDPEFIRRLTDNGGKLIYHPEMIVARARRATLSEFARQMFRYGRARSLHGFTTNQLSDLFFLCPTLFLGYLCLTPPASYFALSSFLSWPLYLYLFAISAYFVANGLKSHSWIRSLAGSVVFPIVHLAYGSGYLVGYCQHFWRRFLANNNPPKGDLEAPKTSRKNSLVKRVWRAETVKPYSTASAITHRQSL